MDKLSVISRRRIRKCFGKIQTKVEIPNLIQVQRKSYEDFLQISQDPKDRLNIGLQSVLNSIFPVSDYEETLTLGFERYEIKEPKYDVDESIMRDVNYAGALVVILQLQVFEIDEETGIKEIKSIKEQEVYMGEIPIMTDKGTVIINGAERVIVSQMHRSPGVFYYHDAGKTHSSGKYLYSARVIPYRGSWLDIEFDIKDLLYFRIDRKRKIIITTLLKALGMTREDILKEFYNTLEYKNYKGKWVSRFIPGKFKGVQLDKNIIDFNTNEVIIEVNTNITPRLIKKLAAEPERHYIVQREEIIGSYLANDIINQKTGELIAEANDEITEDILQSIENADLNIFHTLDIDYIKTGGYIRNALVLDKNSNKEEALKEIYRVLRPGDPSAVEVAENLLNDVFFNIDKYDLSSIGRMKINARHNLNYSEDLTILTKDDIIAIIKYLIQLKDGDGDVDDIDSLENRRVRSVGELIENQFRVGLAKMERAIIERMSTVEKDGMMPHDLINSKLLMSVVREFFGTSQLSQFMDETNPLAAITHKRRLSALGPGGLTRDRAGFEVRDVHPTHYGRVCPIETPEGGNIGLILSLASHAKVNGYGFIESPFRKVKDKIVTDEIHSLSAIEESHYIVAQANSALDKDGKLLDDTVICRMRGEIVKVAPEKVDYIDVSPKQLVSVAASLIPFLENDDANRALMGSNMQRQAVPLLRAEAPFVGTGMEELVARDSGAAVIAKREGIVERVDTSRIVIKTFERENDSPGVDIYSLVKFKKSNQSTCINQKPIVRVGDLVNKGDILADGPSIDCGELALGKNLLVAFMPRDGYNFEDAILLSEKIVRDDIFTSIHIEEFEVMVRDTRLGSEELTRDIPNIPEEQLGSLDEVGVVRIGAEVEAGDILVGKVTPKSESPITPEEKLLRAIFGQKADEVRDSSLRVPPGIQGVVVNVRIFTRRGVEKDERAITIERIEIANLIKDRNDETEIIQTYAHGRIKELLIGKAMISGPKQIKFGSIIDSKNLEELSHRQIWQIVVEDANTMSELEKLKELYDRCIQEIENRFKRKVEKIQSGDDLPQGALKVVKVYVATKQKIQPGDKMAGRHGNKGVVSKISPIEDMPFLEDGTPVDIVLNPLGVPSRMNIGQILETHLGWAAVNLGKKIEEALEVMKKSQNKSQLIALLKDIYNDTQDSKTRDMIDEMNDKQLKDFAFISSKGITFSTPVFDGAKEDEINNVLKKSGVQLSGQVRLTDGKTGRKFDRDTTVGYIYMMKLDHLVDDKIHARSIGPYSLVTQQPLGGKSCFGGQRFGEMEVWALQAYGAAFTLQEMLTIKSDDVTGRVKAYESIVRGNNTFTTGRPESFNVIIKELRSLGLNVEMKQENESINESESEFQENN